MTFLKCSFAFARGEGLHKSHQNNLIGLNFT